jgi:hypothetical protein
METNKHLNTNIRFLILKYAHLARIGSSTHAKGGCLSQTAAVPFD